jgi:membrane-associated phospholipid phosphatase
MVWGVLRDSRWRTLIVTLVAAVAAVALGGVFGWVTGGGARRIDLPVERWVLDHRAAWATSILRVLTSLGSSVLLWPVVGVAAIVLVWRGPDWPSAAVLVASLGGALLAKDIVKPLVHRSRPPAGAWLTGASGLAYPSGHAMQALAVFGALALVLSAGRSRRVQAALWAGALLVAFVVGWSRVYLGVHWLTDVLGGYALAGALVALLAAVWLALRPPAGPPRSERCQPAPGP